MAQPNAPIRIAFATDSDADRAFVISRFSGDPAYLVEHVPPDVVSAGEKLAAANHDVCLMTQRLALESSDLLALAVAGSRPVLVLVETDDPALEERLLASGVWECLRKADLTPSMAQRAVRRALIQARHVRDRQVLDARFRQSQKMEAIGRLAGGVAHDFNNLLTAMIGYAAMLRDQADPSHPWHHYIEEIHKAAERGSALTGQLLMFSRQEPVERKDIDLNAVVAGFEKMLKRLIGEDIEVRSRPGRDLGLVRADPHQIEQVLLNLAINARDAMRGGGTLTIETENVGLDAAYARTHPGVLPGPYVMLAVTDTGSGMTPDIQSHLFEPFFTTKERGTGFGLATAYGIVTQSGGHIWVYSEPGRGSSFKIYLPRVPPDPAPVAARPADADAPGGTETILLVEDEPAVRELARDVLEQAGYNILVARNGREALTVAQAHGGRPLHLVLTDVVMPGMNGRELVRHLRWSRPAARVVFMSGYTDHTALELDVAEYWTSFLQKPFTPSRLLEIVRRALDTQNP